MNVSGHEGLGVYLNCVQCVQWTCSCVCTQAFAHGWRDTRVICELVTFEQSDFCLRREGKRSRAVCRYLECRKSGDIFKTIQDMHDHLWGGAATSKQQVHLKRLLSMPWPCEAPQQPSCALSAVMWSLLAGSMDLPKFKTAAACWQTLIDYRWYYIKWKDTHPEKHYPSLSWGMCPAGVIKYESI